MDMKNPSDAYRCAYCKKEYNSPVTRANCELECFQKREKEREEAERKRLAEENRLKRLRYEAEHAALEQELGELIKKMYDHAEITGMRGYRYVHSNGYEKMVFDFVV